MSTITLPALVLATVGMQSFGQVRYDVAETSDETGDSAVNAGAPPRWTVGLRAAQWLTLAEAAEWEAMLLRLRGGINVLAVYDLLRPAPLGTMRGAPVLGAATARSDSALVLTNVVGTLNTGDWLGVGSGAGTSQLVKVMAPVASSVLVPTSATWLNNVSAAATWVNNVSAAATWWLGGTVTVVIEPPMRDAYGVSTPITWDKPVVYVAMTNNSFTWQAGRNGLTLEGYAFDGVEQWR